jgi:hypothetical protein
MSISTTLNYLKYLTLAFLLFFAATSCKKSSQKPKVPLKLDTASQIARIKFGIPNQYAITLISNNVLDIIYYENVSLFVPNENEVDFTQSMYLKEDFSATLLKNVAYTTIDADGTVESNSADGNLNDVASRTITDTTIAGIPMKNIAIQRPFFFKKIYIDNATAIAAQDSVDAIKNDKINYSSSVYFNKVYPAATASASVTYIKSQ